MIVVRILLIVCSFSWLNWLEPLKKDDIHQFLGCRPVRWLRECSYTGVVHRVQLLGRSYPAAQYAAQAAVLGTLCGLLCYATTEHFLYSLIVASLAVFFLPLFFYLNLKRLADEKTEKEVMTYVSTAIMYLRENKNSLRILKDCAQLAEEPLKSDLEQCVLTIEETSDFCVALDRLEQSYPYSQLRNLHLLLKGKKLEGGRNVQLIDYLFANTEESELLINDYRQKKAASRNVFYFMLVLNLLAALVMKKMFHSSSFVDLSTPAFRFSIFIFYLLNAATVIGYERWCSRNDRLE